MVKRLCVLLVRSLVADAIIQWPEAEAGFPVR